MKQSATRQAQNIEWHSSKESSGEKNENNKLFFPEYMNTFNRIIFYHLAGIWASKVLAFFYVLFKCLGYYLPPDSKHLHLKIFLSKKVNKGI